MSVRQKKLSKNINQQEKFRRAAKEVGATDSEEEFERKLKQIAKPVKPEENGTGGGLCGAKPKRAR